MERTIVIDPSWIQLQVGLYLEEYNVTIMGTTYLKRKLHSSDGYCFYDVEDTNEPPIYMQNISLANEFATWTHEQLNARFISIPIEEGMEIANTEPETETANTEQPTETV